MKKFLSIHQEIESAKSRNQEWVAYKFTDMPLAAILPMFGKIERDFKTLESSVLEHLLDEK
ncbi:MAG: hypothetical protein AAF806_07620 [Bacteroidota bacterium]